MAATLKQKQQQQSSSSGESLATSNLRCNHKGIRHPVNIKSCQ